MSSASWAWPVRGSPKVSRISHGWIPSTGIVRLNESVDVTVASGDSESLVGRNGVESIGAGSMIGGIARLSAIALDIAQRHASFVEADWARDAVEEILDTDELDAQARLVVTVLGDCERALADKRLAD